MLRSKEFWNKECWNKEGAGIGLRRVSLRFSDSKQEEGFLKTCSNKLLVNAFRASCALFVANCFHAMSKLAELSKIEKYGEGAVDVHKLIAVTNGATAFLGLVVMVVCGTPCIYKRFSESGMEVFIMLMILGAMCLNTTLNGGLWVSTKMFSGGDPVIVWDRSCFCETKMLLLLDTYITATHIALPIRWFLMLVLEVAAVALYVGLTSIHGSPNGDESLANGTILLLLITLSGLGKRAMEVNERKLFVEVAKEKTLRCEAEFRLDQASKTSSTESHAARAQLEHHSDNISDVHSYATTTASKLVFDTFFPGSSEPRFDALFKLGLQEHWLISQEDVFLLPQNPLGAGSYGVVVTGFFHHAKVAVKLSRNVLDADHLPSFSDLANELRMLRQCRHPNLLQFYGAILDPLDRRLAIVVELLQCCSLEFFMSQPSISVTVSARYDLILCCCRALCYLHSRMPGIIHGDVKSSNVLIEKRSHGFHAKLADFGLSRLLTRRARPLGGTPGWMAPELYKDPKPRLSSDVFSFGRLVFFIATGIKPMGRRSKHEIKRILKSGVLPPLEWPGTCPIEEFCKPCVENCSQLPESHRPPIHELQKKIEAWPIDSELVIPKCASEWSAGLKLLRKTVSAAKSPQPAEPDADKDGSSSSGVTNSWLHTIPEDKATTLTRQVLAPQYKRTPRATQQQLLMLTLLRCNCVFKDPSCCVLHAALKSLMKSCKEVSQRACDAHFFDAVQGQCMDCCALAVEVDEDGVCEVCGGDIEREDANFNAVSPVIHDEAPQSTPTTGSTGDFNQEVSPVTDDNVEQLTPITETMSNGVNVVTI